jgi:hypothetical protein
MNIFKIYLSIDLPIDDNIDIGLLFDIQSISPLFLKNSCEFSQFPHVRKIR